MRENVTKEERLRAIQRGVDTALRESALLGHSVCIWRDGKVVWLTPAEVLAKLADRRAAQSEGPSES
jgi:hypothetical protein